MTVTVCDFCGRHVKGQSTLLKPISSYNFAIIQYGETKDICDDCKKSFEEWQLGRKKIQASMKQKISYDLKKQSWYPEGHDYEVVALEDAIDILNEAFGEEEENDSNGTS